MAATAAPTPRGPVPTTSPPRPTSAKYTVFLRSPGQKGTLKVRLPARKTAQAVLRAFAGAALGDAARAAGLQLLHPVTGAPLAPKARISDVAQDGAVLDVAARPPASPHTTPPRSPARRSLRQERSALRTRQMVRESTVAVDSMRARLSAMGILRAPRLPPQTPLLPPPPPPPPLPAPPRLVPPLPAAPLPMPTVPVPPRSPTPPTARPHTESAAAPDPHAALRAQLVHLARTDVGAFEALVDDARREGRRAS